jgi:hypothetical protein
MIKNYYLKIKEKGQKTRMVRTHSLRKFTSGLRTINWQNSPSVYLRVNYGKALDVHGRLVAFFNDGQYDNEQELLEVFKAFNDEE